ncbi:Na(+)-translocating NADH-quinone reductase subunit A [Pelagibacterium sediminicola]|uniref:Na(+)-translocating NADH-quinone reductase subunit A n=1 Tax=Pelagibacterium sediminicola TaxID=2248761 RepID=UPI001FE9E103|nr:Na(+)-translocating NADH-quinone reductase subunit A [Pelagibacterium sediminicola]
MPEKILTSEAGVSLAPWMEFRVEPLAEVGSLVAQGAPILRDRRRPECIVTAPIAGRVAELETGAGRRLTSLIVQAEGPCDRHQYDTRLALGELEGGSGTTALRQLLQSSGLWMRLRARPFGKVPEASTVPAAIVVMAVDTRPLAPDPRHAIGEENTARLNLGLRALSSLCDGPIFFCQDRGPDIPDAHGRLKIVRIGELHPEGLAGLQIHRLFPARLSRQVWDISMEDVVAIGQLLSEGRLPETQVVSVAGPGLREARLVRCPPGADLRELCYAFMSPGPRIILSGSVLDGRESRWLGFHDRQVTVLERREPTPRHWLDAALRRASRPEPVIATAAVEQALGGAMPGMALLRALSVGDDEAAVDLDVLSLVEEDLALVDYVTAASPRFSDLLRAALNRIEANA